MPRLVFKRRNRSATASTSTSGGPAKVAKPLTIESFRYHDALGLKLPLLVLAIEVRNWEFERPELQRDYQFKPGRVWHRLAHQTAGIACHQHYLHATVLTPVSDAVQHGLETLAEIYDGSNTGLGGGPTLDEATAYRRNLQTLLGGADCNGCHGQLEEGFLPIDLEHLPKLASDELPKDLDELIDWPDGWARALGCIGRFKLLALFENSD